MTGTILNAVTAAVMAVWPFFVLYAVTNGLMTLLLAGTACVLGVRLALAFAGRGETARSGRLLSAAGLVLVGLAALLDEADWMLWYPVLVNASLLSVFGASLFSGMPVVERLARLGLRGKPLPPDPDEPENVAQAAKKLGLRHVVLTCSTRDDLPDGGAEHFAKTVRAIRALCPGTTVETLTSDMKGSHEAADIVIAAHPDVFNLNIETVKELQQAVRPQAGYERTLGVLRYVKEKDPTILTKTGFMVGLGETDEQISVLMDDILATGCDILTIGQYLQPSEKHWKLDRYATPEDFARYKQLALSKGFRHVASAPLARSSYRAWEALEDVHDLY